MTEDAVTSGRAPGDVQRRRLVDALREGSATASDLAAHLGVHVTTVRFHLDALERAGTVERGVGPHAGRGRPAHTYRLRRLSAAEIDQGMIEALASALGGTEGDAPTRAVEAGRRWAARVREAHLARGVDGEQDAPADAMERTLDLLGFAPRATPTGFTLHACPFADAAARHQDVVCAVHLGLLREVAPQGGTVELTPRVSAHRCEVSVILP